MRWITQRLLPSEDRMGFSQVTLGTAMCPLARNESIFGPKDLGVSKKQIYYALRLLRFQLGPQPIHAVVKGRHSRVHVISVPLVGYR